MSARGSSISGLESLPEPDFEFLFGLRLTVDAPDYLGDTPYGSRRVIGIEGGEFHGPSLRGHVLEGGSDWIVVRSDSVLTQDVRLTLRTHDEETILMTYCGLRHGPGDVLARLDAGEDPDPSEYYFRTIPLFETAAKGYVWLNKLVAFGIGRRLPDGVIYSVYGIK